MKKDTHGIGLESKIGGFLYPDHPQRVHVRFHGSISTVNNLADTYPPFILRSEDF